jgi:hypothetical protein
MEMLMDKFPEAEEMVLFDDRVEHIPIFHEFLKEKVKEGKIKTFSITVVPAERH